MCENCAAGLPQARPSEALIARAREIEATLPGDRVEEAAFAVFFGQRGGSIPWQQYQRLLQCMEAALARPVLQCDVAVPPLGAERTGAMWGKLFHAAAATPWRRSAGAASG